MYNKLTKSELRIIEETKREGEQQFTQSSENQRNKRSIIGSILLWIVAFLGIALFGYFLLWLANGV